MRWLLDLAIALTRSWVATYTRGLPRDVRAERREEIDCDLWHQQRLADLEREPVAGTAIEILVRAILGIPADLLWRIEAGSSLKTERRIPVNDSLLMKIGLVIAMLGPILLAVNGVAFLLGGGDFESSSDELRWGTAITLASLAIVAGLWLSARAPRLGTAMVALGVVVNCITFHWMAPIFVPIGIAIVAFSALRGGLIRLPPSRPRAA